MELVLGYSLLKVQIGDVLADKFEVRKVLGVGGMGIVVAAHHRELDQLVALKFMLESAMEQPSAVDRFLREARAAARLRSEHVGRVLDVGRLPGGVPYIVMEYLEGEDLDQLLETRGPLPVEEAVEYLLQSCEAMAEAHSHGIVHRDLKPANLFLTKYDDGRPLLKVLDFGISKASFAKGNQTATNTIMGSPSYMSPEQMRSSRDVDHRADIWSLGVILYQLVTARLPFPGESMGDVMMAVMSVPPLALTGMRSALPAPIEHAIMRCLEKAPERRFANVAELAAALTPFAPLRPRADLALTIRARKGADPATAPRATERAHAAASAVGVSTTMGSAHGEISSAPRTPRRRLGIAMIGGLCAIVLIAVAFSKLGGAQEPSTDEPGPPNSAAAAVPIPAAPAPPAPVDAAPAVDAALPAMDANVDAALTHPDAPVDAPRRTPKPLPKPAKPSGATAKDKMPTTTPAPPVDLFDTDR